MCVTRGGSYVFFIIKVMQYANSLEQRVENWESRKTGKMLYSLLNLDTGTRNTAKSMKISITMYNTLYGRTE